MHFCQEYFLVPPYAQAVLKVLSDSKEDLALALLFKDVWRSATTLSGAQGVRMHGEHLMLEWLADSWDTLLLVNQIIMSASDVPL